MKWGKLEINFMGWAGKEYCPQPTSDSMNLKSPIAVQPSTPPPTEGNRSCIVVVTIMIIIMTVQTSYRSHCRYHTAPITRNTLSPL